MERLSNNPKFGVTLNDLPDPDDEHVFLLSQTSRLEDPAERFAPDDVLLIPGGRYGFLPLPTEFPTRFVEAMQMDVFVRGDDFSIRGEMLQSDFAALLEKIRRDGRIVTRVKKKIFG